MLNKPLHWIALIIVVVGIILLWPKKCTNKPDNEPKVNVPAIHEHSDSVTAIVQELILAKDSIRMDQDVILTQKSIIASKNKELARIKYLMAKINLAKPDSSQFEKHSQEFIDSLGNVALEKEALLDLALKYDSSLVATITAERALQDEKDSLNHNLIVRLNDSLDSLETQGKKQKRQSYWKGFKHGFGTGNVTGFALGSIAR